MIIRLELLALVTVWLVPSVNCADKCTQVTSDGVPPCVCETDDHKRIDLRSLANNNGQPAFPGIKGKGEDTYSYNPCYPFTEGECKNVAGCQNSGGTRSIGEQSKAAFKSGESGISIHYGGGNENRRMVVQLNCSKGLSKAEVKFVDELIKNEYTFVLRTECACPGVCGSGEGPSGSSHHHSSSSKIGITGLVIISVFVILITVYCVAGMIVMRVKYEKTGTDIIPNKTLWFGLPSLVKDGCVFTFTPCINYCRNRRGYSKV